TSLGGDDDVLTIGLNRAVTLLAEAKTGQRRGPQLLRELGPHPDSGTVGLYRGRFGPYVSNGGTIASLPKSADQDTFTLAEAVALLAAKGKGAKGRGGTARAKTAGAAKAAANGAPSAGPERAAKTAAKPKRAAKTAASRKRPPSRGASA